MSSARRTPRYVGVISSEPMGPQLMGPHPVAPLVESAPPAAVPSASSMRRNSSGILPLHRDPATRYTPESDRGRTPAVSQPAVAPAPTPAIAPVRGRPRPVVPVDRRPWRVLIVSAAPSAAPRSFEVERWQARTALIILALTATLAAGFVASVVVAVRSPELFGENPELQVLRSELASTRDSLALARASIAESVAEESGDGDSTTTSAAAEAPAAPAPVAAKPVAAPSRPRPLSRRIGSARETAPDAERDGSMLSLMPRSLADLPVIGALASGFSLARRHPLLHRTRPHLGVDLAAPRGTRVSAPAPGRVSFVGRKIGFGLVVELDHGDGIKTRYAHLRSSAVETGEHVTKGEAIAAVGTSGITTGPHLHYEVLVNGRQVDPLRFRFAQPDAPAASGAGVAGTAGSTTTPAPPASSPGVPAAHDATGAALPAPPR